MKTRIIKYNVREVDISKLCKGMILSFLTDHLTSISFNYSLIIPTFDAIMTDKLTASLNKPQINYNDHKKNQNR